MWIKYKRTIPWEMNECKIKIKERFLWTYDFIIINIYNRCYILHIILIILYDKYDMCYTIYIYNVTYKDCVIF